jgi:hypothetical protein
MDRQHRRELKRDKFVDEVGSWTTRARENQRLLIGITAVVVVLAVIGYGIYFYGSNREQKAQDALGTAITAIDSPLVQPGTPNPDAKYTTEQQRTAASEAMFRDVQKNYSGTKAADVSNIYLARIAAAKGDIATSRKLLSDFISEHPKHLLVGAARYSLYQLRIANGEAPQVTIELNAEMAKTTDQVLPPDTILALLAQSYDAQGNSEKSKETYRRIATQFPDSPYAIDAQRRVGAAV